jgi:NADH:ubiquinone oxidoreductase subunit 3 (subunit A)
LFPILFNFSNISFLEFFFFFFFVILIIISLIYDWQQNALSWQY